VRLLAAFSAVVLFLMLSPGVATADSTTDAGQGVSRELVVEIVTADDPDAAMAELSAEQQSQALALIEDNLVATGVVAEAAALTPVEAAAVGLRVSQGRVTGPNAAVAGSGCWSHYYYQGWSLWNMKTAESWMQLNWCASNSRIASSSFSTVGGAALIIRYDGNTRGKKDVGWEVRGLTTHTFSFHLGAVTKCMQIRGGATGLYSRSTSCYLE